MSCSSESVLETTGGGGEFEGLLGGGSEEFG